MSRLTVPVKAEREAIDEIARDIRRSTTTPSPKHVGYVFQFGAGTSVSAGIPSATMMQVDIRKLLERNRTIRQTDSPPPGVSEYQWLMDKLTIPEQNAEIRRYVEAAKDPDGHWRLNHCFLLLTEIWKMYPHYPRTLLTTNFDPLFHYALLDQGIDAKLVRYYSEYALMRPFDTSDFPGIIYLHGYWQNHHMYNSLKDFEHFAGQWVEQLESDLYQRGLIVLGYAGHPSDVFMQALNRVYYVRHSRIAGRVYWCHLTNESLQPATYAFLSNISDAYLVPIEDADSFMLRLADRLKVPQAELIKAFEQVIESLRVGYVETYRNNANVRMIPSRSIGRRRETAPVTIRLQTDGRHERPGENYAGIAIHLMGGFVDLTAYTHVIVTYDADASGGSFPRQRSFEFKLESARGDHIEHVPVATSQEQRLALEQYEQDGVALNAIKAIVIGADCQHLGLDTTLSIKLRSIRWVRE